MQRALVAASTVEVPFLVARARLSADPEGLVGSHSLLAVEVGPPSPAASGLAVALRGHGIGDAGVVEELVAHLSVAEHRRGTTVDLRGGYRLRPGLAFGDGLLVHRLMRTVGEQLVGGVGARLVMEAR